MDQKSSIIVGGLVVLLAFLGSCVHDYATAVPQAADVLILDKDYSPPHDDTSCSTDPNGNFSCSTTHYGPLWTVTYADETRHDVTVSAGTWSELHVGQKCIVQYYLGRGLWGARYGERFLFGEVPGERSFPTR
jgi:hypothetical protein